MERRIIANRQSASARALLRWSKSHLKEQMAFIRTLVGHESPSFDRSAANALGEVLADVLAQAGGRVRRHRNAKFAAHIQADFRGARGAAPILLLGHFDTVWELGTLRAMPFRESQGRLWGPGVLDMKTGIAQAVFALRALGELAEAEGARESFPRPVTILLVADEEVGSESSRALTERLAKQSAAVLVCEPSFGLDGRLKTARKGVMDYTVRVTGRAAHSGLDFEKGQSAVLELARQLLVIEKFTDLKRGVTVCPGVVRGGGESPNVVPAEAMMLVDVRIPRLAQAARMERKFRSLRPFNRACRLEVSGGMNRPPLERTASVVRLFRAAQGVARELGFELGEAAVGGGSDGNFTAALGVPTLDGLGAVGEGAHSTHESVLISEIPRRTALLARLLESL
jgi:glutamate carboxypeptidase